MKHTDYPAIKKDLALEVLPQKQPYGRDADPPGGKCDPGSSPARGPQQTEFFLRGKMREAVAAFNSGQFLKARNILEKLIPDEPRNPLVFWFSGRASFELADYARALSEIRKVVQIHNYNTESIALENLGDFNEPGVHKFLRQIYEKSRNMDAALQETQILMKLQPSVSDHPLYIAQVLIQ